jgi:Tfp pilus assembly protein PilX
LPLFCIEGNLWEAIESMVNHQNSTYCSKEILLQERGSTLLVFLFIMAALSALAVGALQVTTLNLESSHAHRKGKSAFYSAEAGLDLGIQDIINEFENLSVYTTSAENGGDGQGYINQSYRGYDIRYRITNPQDRFLYQTVQGNSILSHYAYTYDIDGESTSQQDSSREIVRETIRILETPLVQWFVFYGGTGDAADVEFTPGPPMTVWGRVHSNRDIYMGSHNPGPNSELRFQNFDPATLIQAPHSITAAGSVFRLYKRTGGIMGNSAGVKTTNIGTGWDNVVQVSGTINTDAQEGGFNDFVLVNEQAYNAPSNTLFLRGGFYDQRAGDTQRPDVEGIRIVGQGGVGAGNIQIFVSQPAPDTDVTNLVRDGDLPDGSHVALIPNLPDEIVREVQDAFEDCREGGRDVDLTDIDMYFLEKWYEAYLNFYGLTVPAGGFLVYASRSPNAAFDNQTGDLQGIRLVRNVPAGSSPQLVDETTIASDNPVYIQGDFNTVSTKGVAIVGDAINFLSNRWAGNDCSTNAPTADPDNNAGTLDTGITVNAALFGGHSATVGSPGTYGGGVHNYMRFHENWDGTVANFKGSLIGLWASNQANGNWCINGNCYTPPDRNFGWDTNFGDPDFWPPFIPSIFSVERVGFLE